MAMAQWDVVMSQSSNTVMSHSDVSSQPNGSAWSHSPECCRCSSALLSVIRWPACHSGDLHHHHHITEQRCNSPRWKRKRKAKRQLGCEHRFMLETWDGFSSGVRAHISLSGWVFFFLIRAGEWTGQREWGSVNNWIGCAGMVLVVLT